jgi:transcription antitermination factor NusG
VLSFPQETEVDSYAEPLGLPWFALQVRARYESMVATSIGGKGYEYFLPSYWSSRKWSDRTKKIELPLFPGYLFCRFDPLKRLPILESPGVLSIVGVGKNPVPVEETEIDAIRRLAASGIALEPWPYLKVGQKVRIERGALSGLEGILQSFKGRQRIVVSVSLLQRSVAAEIDGDWVVPVRRGIASVEYGPMLSGNSVERAWSKA